jgi:hypothetical protein
VKPGDVIGCVRFVERLSDRMRARPSGNWRTIDRWWLVACTCCEGMREIREDNARRGSRCRVCAQRLSTSNAQLIR